MGREEGHLCQMCPPARGRHLKFGPALSSSSASCHSITVKQQNSTYSDAPPTFRFPTVNVCAVTTPGAPWVGAVFLASSHKQE